MRSSLPIWNVGLDGGSGIATAYGSPQGSSIINRSSIPSVVGVGNVDELLTYRHARTIEKALRAEEYVLRRASDQEDRYIGKLAERESTIQSFAKGDSSRYFSDHLSILADSLLGNVVTDEVAEVHIVPGLPVSLYNDPMIEKVMSNLEGTHIFDINGIHKEFRVSIPAVAMEGIGALTAEDIPPSLDEDLLMGFLDIGERTFDIGAADDSLTPIRRKCDGREFGVGMIVKAVREHLLNRYQRNMSVTQIHSLLKKYSAGKLTSIRVEDRSISPNEIIDLIHHQINLIGNGMMTFIAETWNEEGASVGADMGIIVLIGGGAYLFRDFFKARFPQLYVPYEPEFANARSYHETAQDLSEQAA